MKHDIGNALVVREARKSDFKAIIKHAEIVHGKDGGLLTNRILKYHPNFPPKDNFIVVDSQTGKVVAFLCLLRSTCILNSIEVPVGHMEIVGTLPDYRNRGLIRKLNALFEKRAEEYQLPLLVIAGIPYYYRTFGYEYAIPLGGLLTVATEGIPMLKKEELEPVTIAEVTNQTVNQYLAARKKHNSYLDFYRKLTAEELLFLQRGKFGQELVHNFFIIKENQALVGSFYLKVDWGSLQVGELWIQNLSHLPSVLRYIKAIAKRMKLPIRIEPPSSKALYQALEGFMRSRFVRGYAWYVRIPSIVNFLETIRPVMEHRIAHSELKDLTDSLRISWYRAGVELNFKKGKLKQIIEIKRENIMDMHVGIPFPMIYQLLMGYHSLDELKQIYPDVGVQVMKAPIVRVLFPKIRAQLSPEF
ncbi:MAG: GNAT family N-acetyltransferase [Candidatus Thorarchaeota archaeon]